MGKKHIQHGLSVDAARIEFRYDAEHWSRFSEEVRAFLAEHKITQSELARWMHVSDGVVSQFLRGTYAADMAPVGAKMAGVLNTVARQKRRAPVEKYVPTGVAKRIGTLIAECQAFSDVEGRIGLVIGDSGHGKTCCLRAAAEANKNIVYVQYDCCMTQLSLFAAIARAVRVRSNGTLAVLAERLIDALKDRRLLLIIDEASGVSVGLLDRLRQVLVVKSRCSLILGGNAQLLQTIRSAGRGAGAESMDQFNGRLMGVLHLDELAADPDDPLYTFEDVRRLYEYGGIKLSRDGADALRRLMLLPGSGRLRTAGVIVAALHMSAVIRRRGVIDADAILAGAVELGLPIGEWLPMICKEARLVDQAVAVG